MQTHPLSIVHFQLEASEKAALLATEQQVIALFGEELISQLQQHYLQNDKAHLWDHPLRVCTVAMHYPEFKTLSPAQQHSVMFAAIAHDVMLHFGRTEHHFTGAGYAFALIEQLSSDFIDHEETYIAVLEHRASWKHTRTRLVSQIVAAADRGKLEFWSSVRRAIYYRLGKRSAETVLTQTEFADIVQESMLHLIDKYGETGYGLANAPTLYFARHQDEIKQFRAAIYQADAVQTVLANPSFCEQFWVL